jgi:signal transduction histidine kinase/CheY-like chemotaxis protein
MVALLRMRKKLLIVFLYWLFVLVGSVNSRAQETTGQTVVNGVYNANKKDLSQQKTSLTGNWRFYPHQLIAPAQIAQHSFQFIQLPSVWDAATTHNNFSNSIGYASFSVIIKNYTKGEPLALQMPDVFSSYKLFINGKEAAANGQPGTTKENSKPYWQTKIVDLPEADSLELVLQVANFWHSKGGVYKIPVIGNKSQLVTAYQEAISYDLILAGCLLMGGLFFFGLFLYAKTDKAILFFSLFCLFYSYRMAGTELYAYHHVFHNLGWFAAIRMEYMTLTMGLAFFILYTQQLFPGYVYRKYLLNGLLVVAIVYSLIILLAPPLFFTRFMPYFLILMFFYIPYTLLIYIKAYRNKTIGSFYALLSAAVVMIVFLLINLQYFNVLQADRRIIIIGYICFFFLQSMVLSNRFSDRLKQAAQLAQQGLKAKSEFLSIMSHEIRTPLNSVVGMSYLLQRNNPRQDQHEQLNALQFSAVHLLSIVNNILDYNKIEAGKISIEKIEMDLPAIATNIYNGLKTLADEKRIELRITIDEQLTHKVLGDPTRTTQVINNLLHNAIKFTSQGFASLELLVTAKTSNSITVLVKVTDSGMGIAPEQQKIIFDRFTQADTSTSRKYGGTGLGLAISKKILELQNVALLVSSQPGKGASFFFTQVFPLSKEPVNNRAIKETAANGKRFIQEGVNLLLVEDNPMNVLVAKTILEKNGAQVDVAENGQLALEIFDAQKHKLILMDLDMPVMDGYEATRQIRKQGENLPIIALTASMPKEVESTVFRAGLNDIILKPFNPDEFIATIQQHLSNAGI